MKTCVSCLQPKPNLTCGLCGADLCKHCAQFTSEETFAFLDEKPEILLHDTFCPGCYDRQIVPHIQTYNETLERAKNLVVFYKTQNKENGYIRRTKDIVRVKACRDRNEALLRLAFQAAQKNFNCLVDVELTAEKVRIRGYQKSKWHGVGNAVNADLEKIKRIESKYAN